MLKKDCEYRKPRNLFLVNKFVLFRSETRKDRAIAVAPLGYDLENFKIWLKIVFHSRNNICGYYNAGFEVNAEQPS